MICNDIISCPMDHVPDLGCQSAPTGHAKGEMRVRGITVAEVASAIRNARRRWREGAKKVKVTHHGINVVFIPKPCHYYVISASRR